MNINKLVNRMNVKARQMVEEEALYCISRTEEEVMTYYFSKLDSIQQAIDTLYSSLEKEDFVKHDRATFIVVENVLLDEIIKVLSDYNENSNSYVLSVGKKMSYESTIFEEFMIEYCTTLLAKGVDIERIRLEDKKIKHTLARRYVDLLNSLASNMNKQYYGYILYLQDALKFYREHYTIDVNAPKDIEVEVEIEREGYEKIVNVKDMVDLLTREGYTQVRINGSHHIYSNGTHSVPLPIHGKDLNRYLAYGIQKQIKENRLV